MKNKKFKLGSETKYISVDKRPVIRVSAEAYNILVGLANSSGLSLTKVANAAIKYAYDNYESEDDDNE